MHRLIRIPGPYPPSPAAVLEALPKEPGRVLLESSGGPEDLCLYSFATARPFAILTGRGDRYVLRTARSRSAFTGCPFAALQQVVESFDAGLPRGQMGLAEPLADWTTFAGGGIGYLSYDLGRRVERLPTLARDDLGLPELWIAWYDAAVVLDHRRQEATVVGRVLPGRERAVADHVRFLLRALEAAAERPEQNSALLPERPALRSTFTRQAYEAAVRRAIAYIRAGDIFQVNLSQRFCAPWLLDPWLLYRRLRRINPAPFAAFLEGGRWAVASASPERFLRVDPLTRRVETRPIKGTRPRGKIPEEDARYAHNLLASEKDLAELVMIVDLERNDLGRVCEYGTVGVPELRRLEAYPTVWHTVAVVEGKLRPGIGPRQLLRATFPGGSITGAPKVRAMEIIEELEPVRRGVYTGAIGWLGWDGALDLNIAIRTFVVKSGVAYFHTGGGIVADSDPAAEYEETLAKALGLVRALGEGVADEAAIRVAQ
ncbi:MAG: aminodeoxychorismate synthase component I [Armatimonadota bacterium]|nr:aminodeoxychorismate synthase component I [Armatimonadota bacterium]MDR7563856.1 aminodeoxychorismate synthase component I [Armatimonadota bacterium]MDR7567624.1 aminodeoxychorismate synthase component I [Armatimonadota bacterium]MDR7602620.1 aminodeoxychorismate synthase component I [Armatimonadota bacterium]